MSTASENLTYLQDSARYPKTTVTQVTVPTVQVASEEWNKMIEAAAGLKDEIDGLGTDIGNLIEEGETTYDDF